MNPNVAKCLVVSSVLVADGMMTDDEREFLNELIADFALTDEERRTVIELEGIDEAQAIVAQLPEVERREIVERLVDAASADAKLSPHEVAAIKKVTAALKL